MKRTEEADRNVRAGVLGGNPDARKLVDGKKEEAKNSKTVVCEGSLAGDGILVGDEEACWHPVTKRKNNKSQSAQSGGHVRRKKTRRLHKMMSCVSWLRFGPNVVLRQEAQNWRKDGAVEETAWGLFRTENETRRPLQ